MPHIVRPVVVASLALVYAGCGGCSDTTDPTNGDATADVLDSFASDVSLDVAPDGPTDAAGDASRYDTADSTDARDTAPDSSPPDTSPDRRDVATDVTPDVSHPAGLPDPCRNGSGYSLFEFHFVSGGRQSPAIDTWHAACTYSVGNSGCQVQLLGQPQFNGSGDAVITTSGDKIRVRFSVAGLQFSRAWVHTQARSYSTTSSADIRLWSPLHGAKTTGPVDNDFTYNWYTTDWTGYLLPGDDPDLTAIDLFADSGKVAIHAVEVCVK